MFIFAIRENFDNHNRIYFERSDGYWTKSKYDKDNRRIYLESNDSFWEDFNYK